VTLSGGVTLDGAMAQTGATLWIGGGLTGTPGSSLTLAASPTAAAVVLGTGTGTIGGNLDVIFDGTATSNVIRPQSGTLTLGPGVTVRSGTQGGTVGYDLDALVLQGTVSARTPGSIVTVKGSKWSNTGLLEATNDGTLILAGAFDTVGMGTINTTAGGRVIIAGRLNNVGATLTLSAAPNLILGNASQISDGTVASGDGTPLTVLAGSAATLLRANVTAPIVLQPGATLTLDGATLGGNLTGSAATVTMSNKWANAGSIALTNGSKLTLSGTIPTALGTISLSDSTLNVSAATTTSTVRQVSRTNTTLVLQSRLDNAGDTFAVDPSEGGLSMLAGTIAGGSLRIAAGIEATVLGQLPGGQLVSTLDGVTAAGTITVTPGAALNVGAAGLVPDGLKVRLTPAQSGTATLGFVGSQTLGGIADVVFDGSVATGAAVRPGVSTTLTLGPSTVVRTGASGGTLGASSATIILNGLVSARTAGQTLAVSGAGITNNGIMEVRNGSTLKVIGPMSASTGTMDLASGTFLVEYPTSGATPIASFRAAARANRLYSSGSGPAGASAVGYVEAALAGSGRNAMAGQLVDTTTLILKPVPAGDANLDGALSADDYAIIDRSYARAPADAYWTDGDFDYDGQVTAADYLLIDRSFSLQTGVPSPDLLARREAQFGPAYVAKLIASVPEPASCGLWAVAAFAMRRGRRRR
jgi:hypothetical protein